MPPRAARAVKVNRNSTVQGLGLISVVALHYAIFCNCKVNSQIPRECVFNSNMGPKKGKKGKKADDDWGNEEDEKKLEEKMKDLAVNNDEDEDDAPKAKGKKKDKKGGKKKKAAAKEESDDEEVDKEEEEIEGGLHHQLPFILLSIHLHISQRKLVFLINGFVCKWDWKYLHP